MINYLAPNSTGLTIEEKQNMFSVINRIEKISYNFPKNKVIDRCFCGQIEDMEHIYNCEQLNPEKQILKSGKPLTTDISILKI